VATDSIQKIRGKCHVQHLFDKHTGDDLGGVGIASGVNRVEGTEIGRYREMLELNRPLEMLA
jgi:hypothetical protein